MQNNGIHILVESAPFFVGNPEEYLKSHSVNGILPKRLLCLGAHAIYSFSENSGWPDELISYTDLEVNEIDLRPYLEEDRVVLVSKDVRNLKAIEELLRAADDLKLTIYIHKAWGKDERQILEEIQKIKRELNLQVQVKGLKS